MRTWETFIGLPSPLDRLDASLQGLTHGDHAGLVLRKRAGTQRNTEPGEGLAIHVPGVLVVDRLDAERVFSAEQDRHFVEGPCEFPTRLDPDDPHRPVSFAGSLADRELNIASHPEIAGGTTDRRVPLGVVAKIGEHGPHLLDRARDLCLTAVLKQASFLPRR